MITDPHARKILTVILIILSFLLSAACQPSSVNSTTSVPQEATPDSNYAGKKILFINSYHAGYAWSDGIEQGLQNVLDNTGIELKLVRMDTKNHPDEAFRQLAGQAAKHAFDEFQPDLVIVSDDNAVRYFVEPYLEAINVPVVFAAISWDATDYHFDSSRITGILKVYGVDQLMTDLKPYAKGNRVGYITVASETETINVKNYNLYFNGSLNTYLVHTFAEFKDVFLRAQDENDVMIVGNNAGVSDKWDDEDAIQFFTQNTKVPTGSGNSWMAAYVLLTVARIPAEQGEWAAQTALRILDGTPVSDIPVARNKKYDLVLNLDIAQQLDVVFSPSMLRNADIYTATDGG
jgi:hypothetical protein